MTLKHPLSPVIDAIWTRCGLDTATLAEDLDTYWERIDTLPPMPLPRTRDINQKYWDWYTLRVVGSLTEGLIRFLKASKDKAAQRPHGVRSWQAAVNAVIDKGKNPLQRFTRVQALIPLLASVSAIEELPFLRFELPLQKTAKVPKRINDEIQAALEGGDHHAQRSNFDHGYHERRSALSNAQLHYASLLALPLMACVDAGLLDAVALLTELVASESSPLRLNNLYPGDSSSDTAAGVPEQMARFLIPGHKEAFLDLLPPLATLDTGLPLFVTKAFTTLIEADDALFEGFLNSLDKEIFELAATGSGLSNSVPPNRWPAYARAAWVHGIILAPWITDDNRAAFGPDFVDWYRRHLAEGPAQEYLYTLYRFLAPYESGETARGFLDAMIAANQAGSERVFADLHLEYLVKYITDPAVLADMMYDETYPLNLRKHMRGNYERGRKNTAWVEFHDLADNQPELLVGEAFCFYRLPLNDLHLLETVWRRAGENAKGEKLKSLVLKTLMEKHYSRDDDLPAETLAGLRRLAHLVMEAMPDQTRELILKETYAGLDHVAWLAQFDHPVIDRVLLKLCAASSYFKDSVKDPDGWRRSDEWVVKVRALTLACPEDLQSLAPGQLRDVLSLIDPKTELEALSPHILAQAAASTSGELYLFLAGWLSPVPVEQLDALGWLDPKFKRFEALSVELLLRKPESEALDRLEMIFKRVKNQTLKDRILDKLEAAGRETAAIDHLGGLDLGGLDAAAQKKAPKKMRASVKKLWRDDMAERFAPLTPALLQWLFLLLEQTTADTVPRTARHILSHLEREQQALLTHFLFERWLDNKGNAAQEWAVLLVDDYGDDRLVPLFLQAVKQWNKKSKPKTNKVIGWLGRLGSVYALSQVKQIYEGRYSESIIDQSRSVLSEVAAKRGMTLEELFEELTPSLDYTAEGLVLDVGGQVYHARFDTKGALVMVHENGKVTKAFPTCKKDDDPALHKAAKAKLSFFKKSLKPILKQQAVNFERYLHQGKAWPTSRWQKLFYHHPLLAALGQSLIWDGELAGGQRVAFRISDEMDLLTVDDDTVVLDNLVSVRLWHPLEWEDKAAAAWKAHLKDYKLKAMIEQVDAPVHRLDEDALVLDTLTHRQGYAAIQASFRHILTKNGFLQEATGDGGRFYSHYCVVGARELMVNFHHTAMSVWLELEEESAIEKVTFYDSAAKRDRTLDQVNPRLIAWIIAILDQIAAKGDGYREDWRSMG